MNHKICPTCGLDEFNPMIDFQKAYLVKCAKCKMVFSVRIPDSEELHTHYSTYNRNRTVSPLTLLKYKELLESFKLYKTSGKVLDVGCGSGFFLNVALDEGWIPSGTEMSTDAVDHCISKGLNVYKGTLEEIDFANEQFDIVTSFEVIEHLIYPKEHLMKIFSLVRPGGLLYLTTPNFNALTRYFLKSDWTIVSYPEHLLYFSAHTLDKSLTNVGFKKKSMIADGISIDRLKNSFRSHVKSPSKNTAPREAEKPKKDWLSNDSVRHASQRYPVLKLLRKIADSTLNRFKAGEFLKATYMKPFIKS